MNYIILISSSNNDKLLIILMILAYPRDLKLSFMLNSIIKSNILTILVTIIFSKTGFDY